MIHLGTFFHVKAIRNDRDYVSILDHSGVEHLMPIYPAANFTSKGFGSLATARSPNHLDHLEIRDVTSVIATPESLTVTTDKGPDFQWSVSTK